jgi:hypothetical protein
VPAGFADGVDDDTLGALSCANGEIARFDGVAWQCDDDLGTDTLGTLTCADGEVAKWNNSLGQWVCAADAGLTLPFSGSADEPGGTVFEAINTDSTNGFLSTAVFGSTGSGQGGRGVYGLATGAFGDGYGVLGRSEQQSGVGVKGEAPGTAGYGVWGSADATSGATYGGRFTNDSAEGTGAFGWATASSGTTYGVRGQCDSPSGWAVWAQGRLGASADQPGGTVLEVINTDSTNGLLSTAIFGSTASGQGGLGVYGLATGSFGDGHGVEGRSDQEGGTGVFGRAYGTSG